MAITFRHDAAGVVPPSNASTRKYGQSLVLQQQQQKYAAQQAGYDRMFDAYKMENQQQFQDRRDTKQVVNQQLRDWQQQDFQKQQMEAARQQQFMDDARKLSSGMIMDDIKNGHYDPATAGKLRKNLVDEADALADKTLDATQRKKVLDAIRADRLLHTSNRMEKPPQPTATDRFNQRKHFDEESGQWFIENSKGDFVPLVDPRQQQQQDKQQQQQLQQQEQQAEQMRPKSAQEYYGENEDKFQKDLDAQMKSMQADFDAGTRTEPVTQDAAWAQMQKDYDFRQQALGKPQYGEPTLAKPYGQALGDAKRGAQNKEKGAQSSYDNLADMNDKLRALENRANSFPKGSKEAKEAWSVYRTERDRIINGGAQPAPEMRSIIEQPGQQPPAQSSSQSTPNPAAPTAAKPYGQTLGDAWNAYTKDQSQESFKKYRDAYRSNATLSDLADKAQALPEGSKEKKDAWDLFHAERDKIIGGATSPQAAPSSPTQAAPTPAPLPTPQPAQSDWDALAAGQGLVDMGPAGTAPATPNPTGQTTPAAPKASQQGDASNYPWLRQPGQLMQGNQTGASQPAPKASSGKASTVPNFGELASARPKQEDQELIIKLEKVYDGQSPQVQSAIGAYLDPKSTDAQFIGAKKYLKENGIDVDKLLTPKTEAEKYVLSQAKKYAKSNK